MAGINVGSMVEQVRGKVEPKGQQLVDAVSAVLAHERGTADMYRRYIEETDDATLRARWQVFGERTQVHVQVAEWVLRSVGGDPSYRSPSAREIERRAYSLLGVDVGGEGGDLIRLGRLLMVENLSVHYWRGINRIGGRMKDPSLARILRDASQTVGRDKSDSAKWNASMFDRYVTKAITGR